MTITQILAWLLVVPLILDGHRWPIPRPISAAAIIAKVAAETEDPKFFAALLDVQAAKESGYRADAAGDCPGMRAGDPKCTRALGAKSCGAYQTPCAETPENAEAQTRLALAYIRRSYAACPAHPLSVYGTGRCDTRWGDDRVALARAAANTPTPKE